MIKKYNWFYIPVTVLSIVLLLLEKTGPFVGKLRFLGFALFTLLCVALVVENKHSKGKILGAILYFLCGVVTLLN